MAAGWGEGQTGAPQPIIILNYAQAEEGAAISQGSGPVASGGSAIATEGGQAAAAAQGSSAATTRTSTSTGRTASGRLVFVLTGLLFLAAIVATGVLVYRDAITGTQGAAALTVIGVLAAAVGLMKK